MTDSSKKVKISGDTAIEFEDSNGNTFSIRDIGIGHPWHTISNSRGRVATDAEATLAQLLIAENEANRKI